MKIKVCGITQLVQLQALQQMGIDYAGLIFYPASKRYAGELLQPEQKAVRKLSIKKIGVFVNADFDTIRKAIDDYGLHAVQLHGDETDEFCAELQGRVKVIKAIRVANAEDITTGVALFENVCDYFLFDTQTAQYGGSGQQFNWQWLQQAALTKPFFLSGGIGPADVQRIVGLQHPLLYAVDVNSGFETAPGIKSIEAVSLFQQQLQHG